MLFFLGFSQNWFREKLETHEIRFVDLGLGVTLPELCLHCFPFRCSRLPIIFANTISQHLLYAQPLLFFMMSVDLAVTILYYAAYTATLPCLPLRSFVVTNQSKFLCPSVAVTSCTKQRKSVRTLVRETVKLHILRLFCNRHNWYYILFIHTSNSDILKILSENYVSQGLRWSTTT